ncbi:MAG TPA: hypothetical protein VI819_03835 [Patescibacteria group bacterium]|nr:hypothetical protein [Patescibacteria group bacterium]
MGRKEDLNVLSKFYREGSTIHPAFVELSRLKLVREQDDLSFNLCPSCPHLCPGSKLKNPPFPDCQECKLPVNTDRNFLELVKLIFNKARIVSTEKIKDSDPSLPSGSAINAVRTVIDVPGSTNHIPHIGTISITHYYDQQVQFGMYEIKTDSDKDQTLFPSTVVRKKVDINKEQWQRIRNNQRKGSPTDVAVELNVELPPNPTSKILKGLKEESKKRGRGITANESEESLLDKIFGKKK